MCLDHTCRSLSLSDLTLLLENPAKHCDSSNYLSPNTGFGGTDKQNALRRECTFKIEIVLEIGVAGVNIYLNIPVLTLLDVLARLAQSVKPWRSHRFLPMSRRVTRSNL